MSEHDSTKPRRQIGCTQAAYDRAVWEADALAGRLGDGWSPVVWENGGWRYAVSNGAARVTPITRGGHVEGTWKVERYSAEIAPNLLMGRTRVQFFADAETPEDALGFATQDARTFLNKLQAEMAELLAPAEAA